MIYKKDNYVAWNIKEDEFPKNGTIEDQIKFLLGYAILAPSVHNTQPWLFKVSGNKLEIFPNWRYKLPYSDPSDRGLFISLGCCITNIYSAASYFNFGCEILINAHPKEDATIEITFLKNKKLVNSLATLFPFITKRYSNKLLYLDEPIDENILKQIDKSAKDNEVVIALVNNKSIIKDVANLHEISISHFSNNNLFRKELSYWIRSNNSNLEDGMPGFVVGSKPIQTFVGRYLIKYFSFVFKLLGKKDKILIEKSPVIGIVASQDDDIKSWINVGRKFEEFALRATSLGLNLTIMNAIIQDKRYLKDLMRLLRLEHVKPQLFFRIGYSKNAPYHTPRRTLKKFLIEIEDDTEKRLAQAIKMPVQIKKVEVGTHSINYLTAGSGQPLLLIHGGNIGWGQWYPNIVELSKNFKIYAIDLPGGGRSSRLDFSKMNLEKDLIDVVYQFIKQIGVEELDIVGSSIGGWIALKLALKKDLQVKKLVLSDCIGFTDYMGFAQRILGLNFLATFLTKTILKPVRNNKNIEKFLRDVFYNKNASIIKEFIDYFYETMTTSHNLLFISRLSSIYGIRKEFILKDVLRKVKSDTLIVWGEKDKLMPIEKNDINFHLIPKVKLNIIKDAGHIPSIEKSDKFNKVVINFLKA